MLQPFPQCDVVCFVEEMASTAVSVFSDAVGLQAVVFGGLVIWVGFILARWVFNGCTFHNKGGSGRRFKR